MRKNSKKKVISIFATTAVGGAGIVAAVAQSCGPSFNNRNNTQEVLSRLNNTGSMAGNNGTTNIPATGTQERLFYDLIETTLQGLNNNENPNLAITRIVTQVPNVNIDATADGTSVTFSPESLIINVSNTTNNSFQFLNTGILTISGIVYSGRVITSAGTINDNGLVLSNTTEAIKVVRNLDSITRELFASADNPVAVPPSVITPSVITMLLIEKIPTFLKKLVLPPVVLTVIWLESRVISVAERLEGIPLIPIETISALESIVWMWERIAL